MGPDFCTTPEVDLQRQTWDNPINLHTFVLVGQERESEARRLRRETDADRQGLEGARQACLERERGLSAMEERLRERGLEADDTEVRCFGKSTTRHVIAEVVGGGGGSRSCSASLESCYDTLNIGQFAFVCFGRLAEGNPSHELPLADVENSLHFSRIWHGVLRVHL